MSDHVKSLRYALASSARQVELVLKGIRSKAIPDQTLLDTRSNGPSMEMTALSTMLERSLKQSLKVLNETAEPKP